MTICHQLKLMAQDGKMRLTDVVDIEGMFRIIESKTGKKISEKFNSHKKMFLTMKVQKLVMLK